MKKKLLALLLVATMVTGMFAGCSKKGEEGGNKDNGTTAGGSYTWHDTTGTMNTFSPTDWQLNNEGSVFSYCSSGLYDWRIADNAQGWEYVPDLATALPTDLTAQYAGQYNIPEDATEGYAWQVTIRQDATWNDGTPITSHDFEYTLQQFLNPEMKNYRASSYYDQFPIANAKGYYNGATANVAEMGYTWDDITMSDETSSLSNGSSIRIAWGLENGAGYTFTEYEDYFDPDLFAALDAKADGMGYIELTNDTFDMLYNQFCATDTWGNETKEDFLAYLVYDDPTLATPWENVGFIIDDDYTFTVIVEKSLSEFYFIYLFSPTLLHEGLYEANKADQGGIIKSSYGTSVEKFASYGPYVLTTYQEGKALYFEKNESWYGYSDPAYEGLYQTTAIDLQIIDDSSTRLNLFLQGKLDYEALNSDTIADYATSDYVYYTPQSYNQAFCFNTDMSMLKSREENNQNKTIMCYKDFRHAVSLAYDRADYCKTCTSGFEPSFGLLNRLYIYDPDTMTAYRDTDAAKQVLCEVYGVSDVSELSGYDVAKASELLQSAYDQCYADGNIDDDDVVTLNFHVYGTETVYQKLIDYLQEALDTAAVGTSLEGRIKIQLVQDQDRYTSMQNGEVDLMNEAWGGADMDPYTLIQVYTDPSYITEYGFNYKEEFTATIQGTEYTMNYFEWYTELTSGTWSSADVTVRNEVLAAMEKNLLLNYHVIPLGAYTDAALYSQRVVMPSSEFVNSLVGFGSINQITYTMNDAEWEAYCAEQGNQLTY